VAIVQIIKYAKDILTSNKWYISKNCQDNNFSKEITFLDNSVSIKEYNNPNFQEEAYLSNLDITYEKHNIFIKIDGENSKCLVSTDSYYNWVSLSCIPANNIGDETKEISMYKSSKEAIKNNKELCES